MFMRASFRLLVRVSLLRASGLLYDIFACQSLVRRPEGVQFPPPPPFGRLERAGFLLSGNDLKG
jgi:hypothetical protein